MAGKGKYAKVIPLLPKFQEPDLEYQDKVNMVKAAITKQIREETGMPPSAARLADDWTDLRALKDEMEKQEKELNLKLEALAQMIYSQYENEGVTSITLGDGASVGMQIEPIAQVEDRDRVRLWAIEEGLERDLQLPWMTLNKLAKDALLEGKPDIPGVKIYAKNKLVRRKG